VTIELKDLCGCRRLAVMGGTFDPIHNGHLLAAEAVRHAFQPERVLFIPSARPPHKNADGMTDSALRFKMTARTVKGDRCFCVSRIECDREGPSYTYETMREIRGACRPGAEIFFIVGTDSVPDVPQWKNASELRGLCRFVAAPRPGFAVAHNDETAAFGFEYVEMPGTDVSSSEVRRRVSLGLTITGLVPPPVEKFIYKHGLYAPLEHMRIEQIKAQLALRLSKHRFVHSTGVAEESSRLADLYLADPAKAYLAGLLHDCAKEFSNIRKRELCKHYKIKLDAVLNADIDLTHSILSAELARDDFKVYDAEVLRAIRYHTTGHKNMSVLDKVVLLADYTEPYRGPYPGVDEIRAAANSGDLHGAIEMAVRNTLRFVKEDKGRPIHSWSLKLLDELKK